MNWVCLPCHRPVWEKIFVHVNYSSWCTLISICCHIFYKYAFLCKLCSSASSQFIFWVRHYVSKVSCTSCMISWTFYVITFWFKNVSHSTKFVLNCSGNDGLFFGHCLACSCHSLRTAYSWLTVTCVAQVCAGRLKSQVLKRLLYSVSQWSFP